MWKLALLIIGILTVIYYFLNNNGKIQKKIFLKLLNVNIDETPTDLIEPFDDSNLEDDDPIGTFKSTENLIKGLQKSNEYLLKVLNKLQNQQQIAPVEINDLKSVLKKIEVMEKKVDKIKDFATKTYQFGVNPQRIGVIDNKLHKTQELRQMINQAGFVVIRNWDELIGLTKKPPVVPKPVAVVPVTPMIPPQPTLPQPILPKAIAVIPTIRPTKPTKPKTVAVVPITPMTPSQPTKPTKPKTVAVVPVTPMIPITPMTPQPTKPKTVAVVPVTPMIPITPITPQKPTKPKAVAVVPVTPITPMIPPQPTLPKIFLPGEVDVQKPIISKPIVPKPTVPKPMVPKPEEKEVVDGPPTKNQIPSDKTRVKQPRSVSVPNYGYGSSEKSRWLAAHNFYRAKHCSPALKWNTKLEKMAKDWAENLATNRRSYPIPHPTSTAERNQYLVIYDSNGQPIQNKYGGTAGQNLAYGPGKLEAGNKVMVKEVEDVVTDWYEEVIYPNTLSNSISTTSSGDITFNPSLEERRRSLTANLASLPAGCTKQIEYKYGEMPECNPQTGHFTQVVWKNSTELGCAKIPTSWQPGGYIWACNYNLPGNIRGWDNESTLKSYNENVQDPKTC